MSLLNTFNRYMEKNQAASVAILEQPSQASIENMDVFSKALWATIASNENQCHAFEIINTQGTSYDFIVKVLIKIGFSCEDAVRLMMKLHRQGRLVLARSDKETLLSLQDYIKAQARPYGSDFVCKIKEIPNK